MTRFAPPVTVATDTVPDGFVQDFLTKRFFRNTPEEYVRQNVERALIRGYQYSAGDCEPEYPIKVGSSRKRVDIVVFRPGSEHKQENAWLLVETKKPGTNASSKKDGIEQLRSYMAACINVKYGIWTNGDDQVLIAKRPSEHGYSFEDDIVAIPAAGQTEEDAQRPKRKDLKPATADNLLFAFRRCHNYIAAQEGKQKPEAFWELLKIIFSKIEDEKSRVLEFYATAAERSNSVVASSAKKRIDRLFDEKVVRRYPQIFSDADHSIDLKPSVIAFVVTQLQGYSLLASPVDVKGVAYEEIVGSNLRGDRGEFFTPRNACRMAVDMLAPRPDEKLLDPTCGTGGFLITAMNAALEFIEEDEREEWLDPGNGTDAERQQLWNRRNDYLSQYVYGADLNPGLVRAAKMNMVMNNDGAGGVYQANTLSDPQSWNEQARKALGLNTFDVIVSNPPFGANILIDDEAVLRQYDLAASWDRLEDGRWQMRVTESGMRSLQSSQPPEILFIERCVQLLKPGTGRMAMVIPNGILNNPALGYVRHWIMTNTQVLAVVDMARELFQPKNDTQTSMVVLRRLSPSEKETAEKVGLDYPIYMAVTQSIGHDKRGNVTYRRADDGSDVWEERIDTVAEIDSATGQEVLRQVKSVERVIDDELPLVANSYRNWLGRNL